MTPVYSSCSIAVPPGQVSAALEPLAGVRLDGGTLCGCWYAEIGRLNRILMVHAFDDIASLSAAHDAQIRSGSPLGLGALASAVEFDAYAMFPGVSFMPAGRYGPMYEVRTYQLKRDGLAATFDAWAKVREARIRISPLAAVMYGISGQLPRFMHIWPYPSLDARMALRGAAVTAGIWPPPGGLPHIETMRSEIYLPAPFSPLQ
jgi:hypothetical protein